MPRIRTIKPEFPQSEAVGRLTRDARLLFIQLWTIADDFGRARASSRMLASLLYPYDDDAPELIDVWLAQLERVGHVRLYEVEGSLYLDIPNWLKHQKIDHPSKSRIPEFRETSRGLAKSSEVFATDLGPRKERKEEKSATSAIFSSVGTESEQSADALALGGARAGSASPPIEQSEESKRLAEQAEDAKRGWKPGMPTSAELRAKYEAMEASNGKAQAGRNHGNGSNPDGNGSEKSNPGSVVAARDGQRAGDKKLDGGQAGERGMESLGSVLRRNGMGSSGVQEPHQKPDDAGPVAGMARKTARKPGAIDWDALMGKPRT